MKNIFRSVIEVLTENFPLTVGFVICIITSINDIEIDEQTGLIMFTYIFIENFKNAIKGEKK